MRAAVIPFANPEIMARRFVRGLDPVPSEVPSSLPGATVPPPSISRPVLASEQRQENALPPLFGHGLDEIGAWRPVWLALLGVIGAIWTLCRALWLAARVIWARHLHKAVRHVLVPQWWLFAGVTGWTLTVSFLLTCWAISVYG